MEIEAILKQPYSRILIPSEGGFSAEILEFPGCYSEGETPDEAMQNLDEAARSWIEASLEIGHDIPEPAMNQGFSGKIVLRMPRALHRQASRMAERDSVSLNQFLVSAVSSRVGAEDLISRIENRFSAKFAATKEIRSELLPDSLSFSLKGLNSGTREIVNA